ncbi:MAG TPA: prenyltransferase/squalene oxidase repeat-containing protein [Allosphingosinicella sp.]|nr:prenyltransferase/squalene oxidase repeat-containing protein [Allosphingosinicella sp.]
MSLAQEHDADLSPVGSLALLWPAIPDGLVSPAARSRLEAAAARLAPIARIALELRLGEDQDEVDLHQYVSRSAADAAALKRYLSQSAPPAPGEELVRRFLHAWADDAGGVRTDLDGVFLEWDGPGARSAGPPAIFLPVQGRHDRGPAAAARRHGVAGHIGRLGLAGGHVASLLRTIPAGISISYVGFMLGRGDAVRLNLRAVRPDDLAGVLAGLGWPGDTGKASALFSTLVGLTGQVALALDFAPAIRPTIGFECALPDFPAGEPRWHELFDRLCADGLCTAAKRAALERVGARLYPEDEGQEWPASWIAAAVMAPPQFVPWFERRLSHLKLSIAADGDVAAKAYVSAQHHWSRAAALAPPRRAGSGPSAADTIGAAAARAAEFLIAERQQDDFWRDFRLVNGASDEWVTAFVGYALATSGIPFPAGLAAQTVRALLGRQRGEGGWGYNRISPADSDSTAWVLKFLEAAGYAGPEVKSARAFLLSHLRTEGGLSTYAASTSLRFGGAAADDSGWRSGHLCVAANAAGLIGEPLVGHLLSSQGPDGAWPAYWWRDDAFATALATESLAAVEAASESPSRAAAWARRRAASASNAFDRAWLIRILSTGGAAERAEARAMALALAADQRPDGGWDSSAEMLFPDPAEVRRQEDAPIVRDENRLFTAASALLALRSALGVGE